MNTLDLGTLHTLTTQVQKLQSVAAELQPFLELIKELDGKLTIDRLVRAGEAADRRVKVDNRRVRQGRSAVALLRQFRPEKILAKSS